MTQVQKTVASPLKTGREDQLQFLRFLAFLNIYIYHGEQWLFFRYPASHCAFAAVSFFFMLSGLVSGYTLYTKQTDPGLRPVGSFLWKKLRRLYPLYFCTVLITVLLSGLPTQTAMYGIAGTGARLKQLIRSLLLMQSWFPEGYYDYNGVGWFLSSMLFLYALTLPAMAVLKKADQHPKRYFLFVFLAGGLLFVTAAYCYVTQGLDMGYWHYIFPPARVGEYLVGMILGVMLHSLKDRIPAGRLLRLLFTILEIAALIYWFRSLYSPGNYWRNHIVSWLIPNAVLLSVFTVGAGWISGLFRCPLAVRLGDVSFECYLIHQIILNVYSRGIGAAELSQPGKAVSFLTCLLTTVMFALFLNRPKHKGNRK